MQFDLLLDPFGARWAEVRDAATAAIDAGFAGIWTYDHLDGRVYDAAFVLERWTVLSALAVAAPGVMLGPLVLNVKNRQPGLLATMAATLQEVSGGRLQPPFVIGVLGPKMAELAGRVGDGFNTTATHPLDLSPPYDLRRLAEAGRFLGG